ncbi:endonuclease domain-containing protein [Amycolatopsis sp. NPDC004079]|uniref:endonuclease domain-containing protein n=1 Tax=Amycolatopsis sp. NPDC004079 TaxID=3154549 RepID=UPI0033A3C6E0
MARTHCGGKAPTGLDAWPERRRETLLWRLALTLDYDGVDDYVRACDGASCLNPDWRPPSGQLTAVLCDDGRHHLFRDDTALCTEMDYSDEVVAAVRERRGTGRDRDDAGRDERAARLLAETNALQHRFAAQDRERHGGRIPHERICDWWTDGTVYRMFAPKTASDEQQRQPRDRMRVSWTVGLLGDPIDPCAVPPARRCTFVGGRSVWPPYLGTDRLGRIRRQLIDHAGSLCHACGRTIGAVVDHDPFTGLCRGLVCWDCNAWVDTCPHLKDCPWAVYLNSPPALPLRLRHPHAARDRENHRARIEYLGIDPLAPVRPWTRRR